MDRQQLIGERLGYISGCVKKRQARALAAAILIISAIGVLLSCSGSNKEQSSKQTGLELRSDDRLLVFAPHPDDESLAPAGVIGRAVKKKIPVRVILMTSGDGYKKAVQVNLNVNDPAPEDYRELGAIRHLESLEAMKKLGVSEKNVYFLAYADGSINSLYQKNWDHDKLHLGLNGATHAPYAFAYEKDAAYCGENVVKNFTKIIKDFQPTTIVYPDSEDFHHDHWATGAFVQYTLTKMGYKTKQYTYLVHRGSDWPSPSQYGPELRLEPPAALKELDAAWFEFPLTKAEESLKKTAIEAYASQKPLAELFLETFVRKNELFAQYPDIRIPAVERKPEFLAKDHLPGQILFDPINDTFAGEIKELGDIAGVGFVYHKNNAWLAVDTYSSISPEVVYAFHLRVFERKRITRLDINVIDGKPYVQAYAKNSLMLDSAPVESENNRLVIEIPSKIFATSQYIMVNVDTYDGISDENHWIDRTGWRRLILE